MTPEMSVKRHASCTPWMAGSEKALLAEKSFINDTAETAER